MHLQRAGRRAGGVIVAVRGKSVSVIAFLLVAGSAQAVTVDRDALMQLCMIARYNIYLLEEDDRLRRQHGDYDAFLALPSPQGICEQVGIDANKTGDTFPNINLDKEKQRIAGERP